MWTLNNSDLEQVDLNSSSQSFSILQPTSALTGTGTFSTIFKDFDEKTSEETEYNEDTETYDIPLDTEPQVVYSGGRIYTRARDITNPQPGEFTYINGIIKIYPYNDEFIEDVTYVSAPVSLKSLHFTNIPSLLYGLPLEGGFSISESFQDHPSSNLVFITTQQYLPVYRNRFKTGALLTIYNYAFIVNNYAEEIQPDTLAVKISVSLRGKWDIVANTPFMLRDNITVSDGKFIDPECQAFAEEKPDTNNKSINALAAKVGASVSGISFQVDVPNDKSDFTSSTISSELGKWLDIKSSFVDYTNQNAILVRNIDSVSTWTFNENDLLSPFSTTINSLPEKPLVTASSFLGQTINTSALVPAVITRRPDILIAEDLNNIPEPRMMNAVTGDIFNDSGRVIKPEPTKAEQPKFELRKPVKRTNIKGDPRPDVYPQDITRLTLLTHNFDNGGVTKTQIITTEEDGCPITETTLKFGFAYSASEIAKQVADGSDEGSEPDVRLDGNPANHWKLIEKTITNYIYDEKTGYLLGYNMSGARLLRCAVEPEDCPTIELDSGSEPLDEYDTVVRQSYIFRWAAINGAKRHLLVQHRDYYKNFESEPRTIKKCNRDGTSSLVPNPNYVEPMFSLAESEEIQCFNYMSNPENVGRDSEDPILPPLNTGQETYNRSFLQILPSKNQVNVYGITADLPEEDKFITYTSTFTAQEPGFSTIVEQTTTSESAGIPPVHTRKPPKYELVEPKEKKPKEVQPYRYVVYTRPYNGGYPREGSVGFEKAETIQELIRGVENQLKIQDIRNTLSSSCTVPINLNMRTGDICIFNVGGIIYRRRITALTHQFILEGADVNGVPYMSNGGTNLSLGLDRPINVQYKKEKVPGKSEGNNQGSSIIVNTNGLTLGSLLPKQARTRGNYYEGQ